MTDWIDHTPGDPPPVDSGVVVDIRLRSARPGAEYEGWYCTDLVEAFVWSAPSKDFGLKEMELTEIVQWRPAEDPTTFGDKKENTDDD